MNQTYLMVGAATLLAIAGIAWYVFFRGRSEGFADSDAPSFTLYYASWCPHCKDVAPVFKEWAKNGTVTVGGKTVFVKAVEEKEIPAGIKDKVKGFPTFLYSKGGNTVEYSGSRDASGWEAFLAQQA